MSTRDSREVEARTLHPDIAMMSTFDKVDHHDAASDESILLLPDCPDEEDEEELSSRPSPPPESAPRRRAGGLSPGFLSKSTAVLYVQSFLDFYTSNMLSSSSIKASESEGLVRLDLLTLRDVAAALRADATTNSTRELTESFVHCAIRRPYEYEGAVNFQRLVFHDLFQSRPQLCVETSELALRVALLETREGRTMEALSGVHVVEFVFDALRFRIILELSVSEEEEETFERVYRAVEEWRDVVEQSRCGAASEILLRQLKSLKSFLENET